MASEYVDFVTKKLNLRGIVAQLPRTHASKSRKDLNKGKQDRKNTHNTLTLNHKYASSYGSVILTPKEHVLGVQVDHKHYEFGEKSQIMTLEPKKHKKVEQLIHTLLPRSLADSFDSDKAYKSFLENLPKKFGNPKGNGEKFLVNIVKDLIREHVDNGKPFSVGKGYDHSVTESKDRIGETELINSYPIMSFTTYTPIN